MKLANGESLVEVLSVTALGILIVFAALIVLMLVLNLMKLFAPSESTKNEVVQKPAPEVPAVKCEDKNEDEDELIAVLTAAIAASLKTSTYNLKIRSYRRVK